MVSSFLVMKMNSVRRSVLGEDSHKKDTRGFEDTSSPLEIKKVCSKKFGKKTEKVCVRAQIRHSKHALTA